MTLQELIDGINYTGTSFANENEVSIFLEYAAHILRVQAIYFTEEIHKCVKLV